jgi:hypothetical protein
MSFSMPSYLLGVGTVVGALTLGFGGGVLLTKTAIKETANGPSRIERAARPEPNAAAPQVQVTEARAIPVPRAEPPAVQPAPPVQAAVENPKPVVEAAREEPAKQAEPVKQAEVPRELPRQEQKQTDAPKQIEQREAEQRMTGREQRRAEREQRRIERERQYAERRARAPEPAGTRLRVIEQPARPELAFEREQPRPNLFEGLFGKPADPAPAERE